MINAILSFFNDTKKKEHLLIEFDEILFKYKIILKYDYNFFSNFMLVEIYIHEFRLTLESIFISKINKSDMYQVTRSGDEYYFEEIVNIGLERIKYLNEVAVFLQKQDDNFLNLYKKYKRNQLKNYNEFEKYQYKNGIFSNYYYNDLLFIEDSRISLESYMRRNATVINEFLFDNKIKSADLDIAIFKYMEKERY